MTRMLCRMCGSLLLGALLVAGPAAAQAISFSISGPGTSPNDKISATGTGTLTPGGNVNATVTGSASNDSCANQTIQFSAKLALANSPDSFTILLNVPQPKISAATPSGTVSGSVNVTAGTGAYANKGGTGNATLFVAFTSESVFTYTLNGTVTLAGPLVPAASLYPGGITPVFSDNPWVQSGSWISIYGANLASATTLWNGDFPTSLGGVTVNIDGKNASLWFVSAGQINAQIPDTARVSSCAPVIVNTPNGSISTLVEVEGGSPSFSLLDDNKHIAAIIPTPNGGGAYAGGTYDIAGPVGAFSYATRPVKRGETVELFGVGFGATNPPVPAGKAFSGAARAVQPTNISLGDGKGNFVPAQVPFSGLVGAGLFQINVTIPQNSPTGDVVVQGFIGPPSPNGLQTSTNITTLLAVQ